MRKSLLAIVGVVSLGALVSACQSTAEIDVAIQQNLPKLCTGADVMHVAFTAAAAAGRVSQRTAEREALAYATLRPLCADPSRATTASVLVAATQSYFIISTALREAEGA